MLLEDLSEFRLPGAALLHGGRRAAGRRDARRDGGLADGGKRVRGVVDEIGDEAILLVEEDVLPHHAPVYLGLLLQHVENYVNLAVVAGQRRDVRVKEEVFTRKQDAPQASRQAHRAVVVDVNVRVESVRSRTPLDADEQSLYVVRLAQVLGL